jgi:hypothetical protein
VSRNVVILRHFEEAPKYQDDLTYLVVVKIVKIVKLQHRLLEYQLSLSKRELRRHYICMCQVLLFDFLFIIHWFYAKIEIAFIVYILRDRKS